MVDSATIISALALGISAASLTLSAVQYQIARREGRLLVPRVTTRADGSVEMRLVNPTGESVKVLSVDLVRRFGMWRLLTMPRDQETHYSLGVEVHGPPAPFTVPPRDQVVFSWEWPDWRVPKIPKWKWLFRPVTDERYRIAVETATGDRLVSQWQMGRDRRLGPL